MRILIFIGLKILEILAGSIVGLSPYLIGRISEIFIPNMLKFYPETISIFMQYYTTGLFIVVGVFVSALVIGWVLKPWIKCNWEISGQIEKTWNMRSKK